MPSERMVKDALMRTGAYRREVVELMEQIKSEGKTNTPEFEMLSRSYALTGNLSMHLGDLLELCDS